MLAHVATELPITRKMILIMVLTSTIAVLTASALFGITEALNYRSNVATDVATLGDVIGTNSTAAITFEDAGLARQVLLSLAADTAIENAQMFARDGTILATYEATTPLQSDDMKLQSLLDSVATTGVPAERFEGLSYLDAVRPIFFDGELIGFLHLRSSLNELAASLKRIGVLAVGAVLFAILVAYFIAFKLQSVISGPIVSLSRLMKRVTNEQNYNLRTRPTGTDEIGTLMRGFNAMLEQISSRDLKLEDANTRLQLSVAETLEARDSAVSASRAKSDFLARMSHEIRTPMNGVLGMTELLISSDLQEPERKFAETIQQSGDSLLTVINDILDFSKIEAGKLVIEESKFDLTEVVEGIVDLMYNRARGQGVELIGAIDPDLRTTVRGDAIRLRQVLMNLVGNAIKFTQDGEVVLRLSSECSGDDLHQFRFEVTDTGIGIDAEHVDRIFDSFAQADISTTREYGGTGLGLAISKQLVELMGGEIGVTSAVGEGSTFWFTVPLPVADRLQTRPGDVLDSLYGMRVLVVDDNATNREILYRQLRAWKIDAAVAENAAEAMSMIDLNAQNKKNFDLLLLDFYMPDRDGLSLAADIRARSDLGHPGILMLSSAGKDYGAEKVREAGVDLYLTKPVRKAVLHSSIIKVLQESEAADAPTGTSPVAKLQDVDVFPLTVLIVEDIPINLQVARYMLLALGCNVVEAQNGKEALDAISNISPDIVFMDCQMPVMDGYTATRDQRRRESDSGHRVPIIALTANALDEDRQKCLDAGMDDFISKPFSRKTLVDVMSRWAPAHSATPRSAAPVDDQPEAANGQGSSSQAATTIERAVLDQIAELDPDNGCDLVCSVIDTYLENANVLVSDLQDAGEHQDLSGISRVAHALKSSSANVGAVHFADMCRTIETQARNGDLASAVQGLREAANEYQTVVTELQTTKKELAA